MGRSRGDSGSDRTARKEVVFSHLGAIEHHGPFLFEATMKLTGLEREMLEVLLDSHTFMLADTIQHYSFNDGFCEACNSSTFEQQMDTCKKQATELIHAIRQFRSLLE